MKTVFLLRHGKSKEGAEYKTDLERPLAKRGKREAEFIGQWMAEHDQLPALIVSSPAERARDTALRCARAAGYAGEVRLAGSLYACGERAYLDLLIELDDAIQSAMLVGHNPDLSIVVEALSGEYNRMPTGALARIDLPVEKWSDLPGKTGVLAWVQVPEE